MTIAAGLFAVVALTAAAPASAQSGQGLPTRDEVTQPVAPPPTTATRLRVEGDIERAPCPLADPKFATIRLNLHRATFNGLKGATAEELAPLYARFLGDNRPAGDICEIRDAVATYLRRKGYLAAVQVPVQQIDNGDVRFEVLYARLTSIRVRGDAGASEKLVASYLDKLTRDEIFNQYTAERYLLLARDLPGIDVRLALKPAGKPGEVYGEVTLVRTPVQADLNVQNMGATATGRVGGQARVLLNGLTGLGDQTSIAVYSTSDFREQQVVQLGHQFRVGSEGLQFAGRLTYAWTRPDLAPSPDVLRARTLFATAEARYPIKRTQGATMWGAGGMDFVTQRVRFAGTPLALDKLRVAYLRLDGDRFDTPVVGAPRWHLGYSIEARRGLGIFDASDGVRPGIAPPSRVDGDATATVIRANVNGEASLARNLRFAVTANGQYAFDPLLAFEEYSAGVYTIGRGYDPGTLLGDSGVGLSAELRLDRLAFTSALAVQPFVFGDVAQVWNRNVGIDDYLLSFGGGVRASFANRFRLDLTMAVPVRRTGLQTERGDPRLLASFTTKLWPLGGN